MKHQHPGTNATHGIGKTYICNHISNAVPVITAIVTGKNLSPITNASFHMFTVFMVNLDKTGKIYTLIAASKTPSTTYTVANTFQSWSEIPAAAAAFIATACLYPMYKAAPTAIISNVTIIPLPSVLFIDEKNSPRGVPLPLLTLLITA